MGTIIAVLSSGCYLSHPIERTAPGSGPDSDAAIGIGPDGARGHALLDGGDVVLIDGAVVLIDGDVVALDAAHARHADGSLPSDAAAPSAECDGDAMAVVVDGSRSSAELASRVLGEWEPCDGTFAGQAVARLAFRLEGDETGGTLRGWAADGRLVLAQAYSVQGSDRIDVECGPGCTHPLMLHFDRASTWMLERYGDPRWFRRIR